jgi:hypothetical protein
MAIAKQKDESVVVALHNLRGIGMDAWARAAVQVTGSAAYGRFTKLLTQPGLIAVGLMRKNTESAMAQMLGQLNLPSRTDVLGLSTRLTHIETVLDDLGAVLDDLKATQARPAARAARGAVRGAGES